MVNMTEEKATVRISLELYNKIREKVKLSQGDFNSPEEYIEFMLREILDENANSIHIPQEEIKRRLKRLGYI
jgi:Arc/MetJ-type ribon-helix-helix transcriptional regulator